MKISIVVSLFVMSAVACDGALSVGGPDAPIVIDTSAAAGDDGELGTAESVDPVELWDSSIESLKSPWGTSSCRKKGRWANACTNDDNCCPEACSASNDNDCAPPAPTPDPAPTCGDGVIDDGELCDGDCPVSCDAPDACTIATLTGSADTCDAMCQTTTVSECTSGDGCCPSGCTSDTDADCPAGEPAPTCGDGNVDAGELCDGNCPTSCSAPNACTTATLSGSSATCDAMCQYADITACVTGDGCCAPGCTYDNDQDCPAPPAPTPAAIDCRDDSTWPQAWKDFEAQVITLVNQRRAAGADCGTQGTFGPAGAVSMNPQMREASRCHSLDMDVNGYFSHTSLDGRNFVTRLAEAGYGGSPRGENIAAGYSSPSSVVTGWMNSDGHCRNIMNSGVNRMGIGFTNENRATWTMTTGVGD